MNVLEKRKGSDMLSHASKVSRRKERKRYAKSSRYVENITTFN